MLQRAGASASVAGVVEALSEVAGRRRSSRL
jgi:hypothetical protein